MRSLRMDAIAQQARGDGAGRWGGDSGGGRARYDGVTERSDVRTARHHAGDAASDPCAVQDACLAGAGGWQAAEGHRIADAGAAYQRRADRLAGSEPSGGRDATRRGCDIVRWREIGWDVYTRVFWRPSATRR